MMSSAINHSALCFTASCIFSKTFTMHLLPSLSTVGHWRGRRNTNTTLPLPDPVKFTADLGSPSCSLKTFFNLSTSWTCSCLMSPSFTISAWNFPFALKKRQTFLSEVYFKMSIMQNISAMPNLSPTCSPKTSNDPRVTITSTFNFSTYHTRIYIKNRIVLHKCVI